MRDRREENQTDKSGAPWWRQLSHGHYLGQTNQILAREIGFLFSAKRELDRGAVDDFIRSQRVFLNHVALADIIHRLGDRFLREGEQNKASFQRMGGEIVREFTSSRVKPGPREVATVWRAAGILDIQESECLEALARRVKRLHGAFEPIDLAFTISGLASVTNRSKPVRDALMRSCASLKSIANDGPSEPLVSALRGLCRGRCIDTELLDEIGNILIKRDKAGLVDSTRDSLSNIAFIARSSALLRHPCDSALEYITRRFQEVTSQSSHEWRDVLRVEAVSDYVWGCAVQSFPVPQALLRKLEAHFHDRIAHVANTRKRNMYATNALPAFTILGSPPSLETTRSFQRLEALQMSSLVMSGIEREVTRTLTTDLRTRFQREFPLGPYRFDFLLEYENGRVVDLEIDGDFHHYIYDIRAGRFLDRRRGSDVLRDKLVESCGIDVVRILASEWAAARDKGELLRNRLGLGR